MFYINQIITVLILLHATANLALDVNDCKNNEYRLAKQVKPYDYKITITPYLATNDNRDFTFDGEIFIKFETIDTIRCLTMHSKNLTFSDIKQVTISPSTSEIVAITFDEKHEFINFLFSTPLNRETNYTLKAKYNGLINENFYGLYRNSYIENRQIKWLAATQFQPTGARQMFPCFDEPEFKTVFNIIVNCSIKYTCLSNMPEKQQPYDQSSLKTFLPTPPMSTYLVSLLVADFSIASTNSEILHSIWSRNDLKNMGNIALKFSDKSVKEMGEYTSILYNEMGSKMKLDHVAVPESLVDGMENWGLITYRETNLMISNEDSAKRKQEIATIITHEISHQWFGNYITCHWWSDVWLNEGFAKYFEYFLTNKIEDFGLEDQFIINQVQSSLHSDEGIIPLSNNGINTENDIMDHIAFMSSGKDASILRMIQYWIGENAFKSGINKYLKDNKYSNVAPSDLYKALQLSANINEYDTTIEKLMNSWVTKSGYPLLSVFTENGTGNIILSQEKFTKLQIEKNELYEIPITYTTETFGDFENTKPSIILKNKTKVLPENISNKWIIFNIQQTGYYRVNYDENLWNLIIHVLKSETREKIHRINRAQIIDDAFHLAQKNYISYSKLLNITQFLKEELEYAPWSAAWNGFSFLRMKYAYFATLSQKLNNYILTLMMNAINHYNSTVNEPNTHLKIIFRSNLLSYSCELGYIQCIENVQYLFNEYKIKGEMINSNLREFVYCMALRYGNTFDFNYLWRIYTNEDNINEKVTILNALGCTNDIISITNLLYETINVNSFIKWQDRMKIIQTILSGNHTNIDSVSTFLMKNIDKVQDMYGSKNLLNIFHDITQRMSPAQLTEFSEFIKITSALSIEEKNIALTYIVNAYGEISWSIANYEEIEEWLNANRSPSIFNLSTLLLCIFYYLIKSCLN